MTFQDDFDWSRKYFISHVWPICNHYLGGGRIISMENNYSVEFAKLLDMLSSIDVLQVTDNGIKGIAIRNQVCDRPWNTFTIRMKRTNNSRTEYKKICASIEEGCLYPYVFIQTYSKTREGPLLSFGIGNTLDIMKYIREGHYEIRCTSNADFAVCGWDRMIAKGYNIVYENISDDCNGFLGMSIM